MRLGITGSREYPLPNLVGTHVIRHAQKYPESTLVSGGSGNVDTTAEQFGLAAGLDVMSYRPTDQGVEVWGSIDGQLVKISDIVTGKPFVQNCFYRNDFIADCDVVCGFWDLQSRGTADTLSKAKGKGRKRFVWNQFGRLLGENELNSTIHRVLG